MKEDIQNLEVTQILNFLDVSLGERYPGIIGQSVELHFIQLVVMLVLKGIMWTCCRPVLLRDAVRVLPRELRQLPRRRLRRLSQLRRPVAARGRDVRRRMLGRPLRGAGALRLLPPHVRPLRQPHQLYRLQARPPAAERGVPRDLCPGVSPLYP